MAGADWATDNFSEEASSPRTGRSPVATAVSTVIVDDDADLRLMARLLLSASRPAIDVVGEAGSCQEVLSLLGECQPDVVVLDLVMPGGDGIVTARAIRKVRPRQLILLWTSNLTAQAERIARVEGITACVDKGDLHHLAEEVRRIGAMALPSRG